jgi:TDG/mug DNA glycosylase family protein
VTDHGHRVLEDWRGEEVETLADLLRPGLVAICIGINPSPVSVAAGHYYQGRLGQLFVRRLRQVGLLTSGSGWEDDLAFASGVGFTDIVKRPSGRAHELPAADYARGRGLLSEKLRRFRPELLIFTFKKTATTLCGPFPGAGFVDGIEPEGIPAFVMPGPYEKRERADELLAQLAARV